MDAETVFSILFGAFLAVFSLTLVVYSFVRAQHPGPTAADESVPSQNDDPALADIFDAINTLQLEYNLARMPEEEYQAQFQAYRIQAATVLKNQLEAGQGDPAWVLEQEVLLARNAMENANGRPAACPDCNGAVLELTGNCPHCGVGLAPQQ